MTDQAQKIYQLIIDAGGSKAGAEMHRQAAQVIVSASQPATAAVKKLNDTVASSQKDWAQLQRSIDPVGVAQRRMTDDIAKVQRAYDAQLISIGQVETALQQIAERYDRTTQRARDYAAAQEQLARANAQAAQSSINQQLDVRDDFGGAGRAADFEAAAASANRLRAQYVPLVAAQQQYLASLRDIRSAQAAGILTDNEAVAAIQRKKTAFAQQVVEINRGAGSFVRSFSGMGMAIQQAGYQVGDFAVQVASGQGVLRPFIQQGTQLISMFGPWGAVIGAAGAVVGALATSFLDLGSETEKAKAAQDAYNKTLETANDLMEKLNGKADLTRAGMMAQRDAIVMYKQAELDTAQAALDRLPKFDRVSQFRGTGEALVPNAKWGEQAEKVRALRLELTELNATLGLLQGGHGDRTGLDFDVQAMIDRNAQAFGGSTTKTMAEVTAAMEEQSRVMRLAAQDREAYAIVDQKLAEMGRTRLTASQAEIDQLTKLAAAQVAQSQATKDAEAADRKSIENAPAVSGILAGLEKQYNNLTSASADVRAADLFGGKIPTEAELQRAEELLKKIDDFKKGQADDKAFSSDIDQIIAASTRGAEQRQKWERTSLEAQQSNIDLLKMQIDLGAANDNQAESALARLKAQQEVHAQMGTALDANALKYIENAEAIVLMNQQLQKQKAVAQELPRFFDQAFDRVGSAITQAMATGEIAMANLLDVGRAVVSELAQEFIKLSLLNPLKNLVNGDSALPTIADFAGKAGGWISSLFSSPYGGAYQGQFGVGTVGGSGMLGHAAKGGYIEVGEEGPERFYPGVSGTVFPTGTAPHPGAGSAMTGAAGVEINVMNYGNDNVQPSARQGPDGKQIIDIVIGKVADDIANNGKVGRAISRNFGASRVAGAQRS